LTKTADNLTVAYTYDSNGNIVTTTDESGTTTRAYDALNRVISKTVSGIGQTRYLYDVTSGVPANCYGETVTDPKGNVRTEIYDRSGRLYQVKTGNDTTTYAYYANGNRQSMTYPNGVTAEYTYYGNNRLHTLANKRGTTLLSTFNYAYDGNGNIVTKLELEGTTSYIYDDLNRLDTVTEPGGKVTEYAYDEAGNRVAQTVTEDNEVTTTSYAYNGQNRLTDTVEDSGDIENTVNYQYDNNGNTV